MRRECRERFPRHRLQRKPQVSDPDMHRGTCVTHVPWCMSGSLTSGGGENNFTYLVRGPLGLWTTSIEGDILLAATTMTHNPLISKPSYTIFYNLMSNVSWFIVSKALRGSRRKQYIVPLVRYWTYVDYAQLWRNLLHDIHQHKSNADKFLQTRLIYLISKNLARIFQDKKKTNKKWPTGN